MQRLDDISLMMTCMERIWTLHPEWTFGEMVYKVQAKMAKHMGMRGLYNEENICLFIFNKLDWQVMDALTDIVNAELAEYHKVKKDD